MPNRHPVDQLGEARAWLAVSAPVPASKCRDPNPDRTQDEEDEPDEDNLKRERPPPRLARFPGVGKTARQQELRKSRSPGAIKSLEHRQRERDGFRSRYVPIHKTVIETLIERGLSDKDARDDKIVGDELAVVLLQWVARWQAEKNKP